MSAITTAPNPLLTVREQAMHLLSTDLHAGNVERDEDDDLWFRYQGHSFVLCFNEQDPDYLVLQLPGFYSVTSQIRRAVVIEACVEATRAVKLVKVYPARTPDGTESISARAEFLLDAAAPLSPDRLLRLIEAIEVAVRTFYESLALANGDPTMVEIEVPPRSKRNRH